MHSNTPRSYRATTIPEGVQFDDVKLRPAPSRIFCTRPQTYVTPGARRLKGNDANLPVLLSFIGAISVGAAVEKNMVFVEMLPSQFRDVVGKAINNASHIGRLVNDACGYQTLHDAVVDAQRIGARLLSYVEPQNLLFIFAQSGEALINTALELSPPPFTAGCAPQGNADRHRQRSDPKKREQPKNWAVVLCKLMHTNDLQILLRNKDQCGSNDSDRCGIAWGELDGIERSSKEFSKHRQSVSAS